MAPRQRAVAPVDEDSNGESSSLLKEQSHKAAPKPTTLNQTEADIARDRHDYFNLVALLLVVFTTALNCSLSSTIPYLSWTEDYFWVNWATTMGYFASDLLWVSIVPICVKSPGVIIKHHAVTMFFLMGAIFFPEYRWFMGALLSVEVNTWFLILRRVVFKSSSEKPVHPVVGHLVSGMFYFTWIVIRCIIYPWVLIIFFQLAAEKLRTTGFHPAMTFIPLQAALCILNVKWSYDLFKPIVKRWLGSGPKTVAVQNGL